jgi:hypothetical protein
MPPPPVASARSLQPGAPTPTQNGADTQPDRRCSAKQQLVERPHRRLAQRLLRGASASPSSPTSRPRHVLGRRQPRQSVSLAGPITPVAPPRHDRTLHLRLPAEVVEPVHRGLHRAQPRQQRARMQHRTREPLLDRRRRLRHPPHALWPGPIRVPIVRCHRSEPHPRLLTLRRLVPRDMPPTHTRENHRANASVRMPPPISPPHLADQPPLEHPRAELAGSRQADADSVAQPADRELPTRPREDAQGVPHPQGHRRHRLSPHGDMRAHRQHRQPSADLLSDLCRMARHAAGERMVVANVREYFPDEALPGPEPAPALAEINTASPEYLRSREHH